MVVLSENPINWYLIAGIVIIILGIFIFSLRSYDPKYVMYYWGTLILGGLIIVIFLGGQPYNGIAAGLSFLIIWCFLHGKPFHTLFSLDPEPLYIQKDPTVWDQPSLAAETNQTDQDPTMEDSAI